MGRIALYSDSQERRKAQNQRRKLARTTQSVNQRIPLKFTGVDGEGVGRWRDHKYVLLGVGTNNIQDSHGLRLTDIFTFLWSQYETEATSVFLGYYLGYDFTQWLKQLPRDRAWYLFTQQGIARRRRSRSGGNPMPFPVHWQGWEFDILGMKRFKLRPYGAKSWMYICDGGSFFQSSFLKAIDPRGWNEPVCTQEEYETIKVGKEHRDHAVLDDTMVAYNTLENVVCSRLFDRLAHGFADMGIRLGRDQWFGPGQGAQEWLSQQISVPTAEQLAQTILRVESPSALMKSSQKSKCGTVPLSQPLSIILNLGRLAYYGGWFEIFCHGHIPGDAWEYDINSAYPHIARNLPCLRHGTWTYATGGSDPQVFGRSLTIAHAAVKGTDRHIGAMLHRHPDGRIVRPWNTRGWYWAHELHAARKAGLIDEIEWLETWTYDPCDCGCPLVDLERLYDLRLELGKDTPGGKAAKLIYNSVYGKFAQSVGNPKFANSIYASLITAGCRTMILDAIATHPERSDAVLMVATDAVFFRTPHPTLPVSNRLGEWSSKKRENLTLFKPGIYWDDGARRQLGAANENPSFKARGINAAQFSKSITAIDHAFTKWEGQYPSERDPESDREGWFPRITFQTGFSMITCQQALQRGKWFLAGAVSDQELKQDSDPVAKRRAGWYDPDTRIYWSQPHEGWWEIESTAYDKTFGQGDVPRPEDYGIHPDGWVLNLWKEGING